MLNVPDEIKELLHRDSCQKNIRIHFPNGERTDICNDLIVMDSVEFTESLCSQNTLKFGLCESPVFECEVVGVGNIKGATIEVCCEIYCDSSVEDAIWQDDLAAWVYQIPYGTFVIADATRQSDMIHRRIKAYNKIATDDWQIQVAEIKKGVKSTTYTPNLGYFLGANGINCISDRTTRTEISWQSEGSEPRVRLNSTYDEYQIYIGAKVCEEYFGSNYNTEVDKLYFAEYVDVLVTTQEVYNMAANFTKKYNYDLNDFYKPTLDYYMAMWTQGIMSYENWNSSQSAYDASTGIGIIGCYVYPYSTGSYTINQNYIWYQFPYSFFVSVYKNNVRVERLDIPITSQKPKLYKIEYTNANAIDNLRLSFETQSWKNAFGTVTFKLPIFENVDLLQLANAYVELSGNFLRFGRNNDPEKINIKQQFGLLPQNNLYPNTNLLPEGVTGGKLLPQDYQTCWYGDYYTKKYGAVSCTYTDTNNVACKYILYLTGYDSNSPVDSYLTYAISGNKIIDSTTWTESQIQAICETIASNIEGVTYMPVEFVGRGLPYVEAGDTFEILTASNDSITTIVLNRTLSGEQVLEDSYKSV